MKDFQIETIETALENVLKKHGFIDPMRMKGFDERQKSQSLSETFPSSSPVVRGEKDKFYIRNNTLRLIYFSKKKQDDSELPVFKSEYEVGLHLILSGVTPTKRKRIKIDKKDLKKAKDEDVCAENKVRTIVRFLASAGLLEREGKKTFMLVEPKEFLEKAMKAWDDLAHKSN